MANQNYQVNAGISSMYDIESEGPKNQAFKPGTHGIDFMDLNGRNSSRSR